MTEQQRARTAVARLSYLSAGTTRNYDSDGRGGEDGPAQPPGGIVEREVSVRVWAGRLVACSSEREFGRVADDVEHAIRAWTVSPKPPVDSIPWQELAAKEPGTVRQAAKEWQISAVYMRQLRDRYA